MRDQFGQRFRECREKAGLNGDQVGAVCRNKDGEPLSKGAISHWENGKAKPSYDNLLAAARLMGASLDYLCGISSSQGTTGLSRAALELAKRFDSIPESAQETVIRCLDWTTTMRGKRAITATDLVAAIMADKSIPR